MKKKIESDKISIDDFYVYGNHLNFSGSIDENYKDAKIILKSKNKELEYDINIKDDEYYLSKKINEGINLDKLDINRYSHKRKKALGLNSKKSSNEIMIPSCEE